jgi:class 3 adenylate cyclase
VKVSGRLQNFLAQSLAQSLTVELMEKLAGRVIPDYDLHRQSGFPPQIPIPQRDAAQLIARDVVRLGQLRRFTEALIEVERDGLMGRSVTMRFLPRLIDEIESLGFVFKQEYGQFVEGGEGARTKGWGVLQEGSTYEFSFLRMDIAGNSKLVRKYPKSEVLRAFADLRRLLSAIVERRDGRIWHWEGDGGIGAFLFGTKNVQAALAGMEMLLELFMYNLTQCSLAGDLHVRLAVHTGPCQFLTNYKDIRSDTLRRLETLEGQYAAPDSLILSPGVYSDLGTKLEWFFRPVAATDRHTLYQYSLGWE